MKKEEILYWLDYVDKNLPDYFSPMKEIHSTTKSEFGWQDIYFIANALTSKFIKKYEEGLEIFEILLEEYMKEDDYDCSDMYMHYKKEALQQMSVFYRDLKKDNNSAMKCIKKAVEIEQNEMYYDFGQINYISEDSREIIDSLVIV